MKTLYTTTFRNIVRLVCGELSGSIYCTWTDKTYRNKKKNKDPSKRIVTYNVTTDPDAIVEKVSRIMQCVGIDPKEHNLRVSYSGYIKCNCVKPGNILL